VAFILSHNGFVSGATPLPEDPSALAQVGFTQ
jgi:hypothetical protein